MLHICFESSVNIPMQCQEVAGFCGKFCIHSIASSNEPLLLVKMMVVEWLDYNYCIDFSTPTDMYQQAVPTTSHVDENGNGTCASGTVLSK